MLYVYLFATILGGVLLGSSFVGADHDGAEGTGHESDSHDAFAFFSLRLWTYFLAIGGITGLLLTTLTGTAAPLVALLSGGVGLGAGVTARTVIQKALTSGSGGTVKQEELVGKSAEVLVPFAKGTTGTVRLTVKNSTVDMMAEFEPGEEGELNAKEEVLIVEVKEGRALVTRNPAAAATRQLPAGGPRK